MNERDYVQAVLDMYTSLPDAPLRPRRDDRFLAARLYKRGVTLLQCEHALLLACARRLLQEHDAPLQPIRSLRYIVPILEEVRDEPVPDGYVPYLRGKVADKLRPKPTKSKKKQTLRNRQLPLPW